MNTNTMNTTTPPPTQPTVQDVNPANLQIEIGENVVALLKCPVPVAELAGMIDHIQEAYGYGLRFMEKPKGWLQFFKP